MRPVVLLILGAVFACDMIYALVTGRLPREGTFVRNPEGGKEWTRIYRSELPWFYWGGVISRGLVACLLFVFAFVRVTVAKSVFLAVPKVFAWVLLLASIVGLYQMIRALVSGKVQGGWPIKGSKSWVYYTYRSDSPIGYWILVTGLGFIVIVGALGWWFVPRT